MENIITIDDNHNSNLLSNEIIFSKWYLSKHFEIQKKSINNNKFNVKCIPCLPRIKLLSASALSTSNLYKHLFKLHLEIFKPQNTSKPPKKYNY